MRQAVVDLASQPIVNHHRNPVVNLPGTWLGAANSVTFTREENNILGTQYVAKMDLASGGVADSGMSFTGGTTVGSFGVADSGSGRTSLTPGAQYRLSFDIISDETRTMNFLVTNTTGAASQRVPFSVTAGVRQRVNQVVTIKADAPPNGAINTYVVRADTLPGTFRISRVMFVELASDPGMHCDGSTPGWRWLGVPEQSSSVGYPYTLESIAGKPVYFAENAVASTTYVKDLTPGGPYTVAACQQVPGTTNSPGLWLISEQASNQARRLLAAGAGTPVFRMDPFRTDGSLGAQSTSSADPRIKHVSVTRVRAGTQPMDMMLNGGNLLSPTFPDTGVAFRPMTITPVRFAVGTRDGLVQSEAPTTYGIAVWEADLNVETMKRVTAWFARKYGTPIPSGY